MHNDIPAVMLLDFCCTYHFQLVLGCFGMMYADSISMRSALCNFCRQQCKLMLSGAALPPFCADSAVCGILEGFRV